MKQPMKPVNPTPLVLLLCGLAVHHALAQGFSSGSMGAYGPMNITSNTTLDLPADGFFHCTTINIASGATLRFRRNPLNTPVYLLASSNVTVNGIIEVGGNNSSASVPDGGMGGPGGFDGGKPGFNSVPPGYGYGPGGGKPGDGNYSSPASAGGGSYGSQPASYLFPSDGLVYGSPLLLPLLGGSGGGGTTGSPGRGGGGGGGAILVASSTRIDIGGTGKILARGGGGREANTECNAGSGGAIRLVAPVVAGTGEMNARGGNSDFAGHGRIRVDSISRTALQLNFVPTSVTSVGSTMSVFPAPLPKLDIVEAAGRAIQEGSGPIYIQLPYNAATNQIVKVQARDFNSLVPVRVVLTPDNGTQLTYDGTIDNRTESPAQGSVNVNMPVNVLVTVSVWTR